MCPCRISWNLHLTLLDFFLKKTIELLSYPSYTHNSDYIKIYWKIRDLSGNPTSPHWLWRLSQYSVHNTFVYRIGASESRYFKMAFLGIRDWGVLLNLYYHFFFFRRQREFKKHNKFKKIPTELWNALLQFLFFLKW